LSLVAIEHDQVVGHIAFSPLKVESEDSSFQTIVSLLESNSDYINDEALSSVRSFVSEHDSELEDFGIDELALAVSKNLSGIKKAFGGIYGLRTQVATIMFHLTCCNKYCRAFYRI